MLDIARDILMLLDKSSFVSNFHKCFYNSRGMYTEILSYFVSLQNIPLKETKAFY